MIGDYRDLIYNYSLEFKDHLQVIAELAKINRTERLQGYLEDVSAGIDEVIKITQLPSAALAAAILNFYQEAGAYGFILFTEIRKNFGCSFPDKYGILVDEVPKKVTGKFYSRTESGDTVVFTAVEAGNDYIIKLELPGAEEKLFLSCIRAWQGLEKTLKLTGDALI